MNPRPADFEGFGTSLVTRMLVQGNFKIFSAEGKLDPLVTSNSPQCSNEENFSQIFSELKRVLSSQAKRLANSLADHVVEKNLLTSQIGQLLAWSSTNTSDNIEIICLQSTLLLFTVKLFFNQELGLSSEEKRNQFTRSIETLSTTSDLHIFKETVAILRKLPPNFDIGEFLRAIAPFSMEVQTSPEFIARDILGRLYQEFNELGTAKHLNMNFTSWEATQILVECALHFQDSAQFPDPIIIADPACGTGALLLRAAFFARGELTYPTNHLLQFVGMDVVPGVILYAQASWALLHSQGNAGNAVCDQGIFACQPLRGDSLGSLALLGGSSMKIDFPIQPGTASLVLMNPPFSRSSGSNTVFGTLSGQEQSALSKKLKILRKKSLLASTGAAGLAADFVLVADQLLTMGGTMAAVLPISVLFGAAWGPVRKFLVTNYHIQIICTRLEKGEFYFSDHTHLSECLLIARKFSGQKSNRLTSMVQIGKLPHDGTSLNSMVNNIVRAFKSLQGDAEEINDIPNFQIFHLPQADLEHFSWSWGPLFRFANPDLNSYITRIFNEKVLVLTLNTFLSLKLRVLSTIAEIAPDRAAYRATREDCSPKIRGNYILCPKMVPKGKEGILPAVWGRTNLTLRTWTVRPNATLLKREHVAPELFQKHVESRAHGFLPETLRFNTSSIFAVFSTESAVSNVFWGVLPRGDLHTADSTGLTPLEVCKILVLWANTTFGLLPFLAIADETDENLFHWKKQTLAYALVPDLEVLTKIQITRLCELFDRFSQKESNELLQERIRTRNNQPLDIQFLQICGNVDEGTPEWKQIEKGLENLYLNAENLFSLNNRKYRLKQSKES